MVEVVLHVGKGARFKVEKVNSGQNVCNRVTSVGNGKIFEKQLSLLSVKYIRVVKISNWSLIQNVEVSTNEILNTLITIHM